MHVTSHPPTRHLYCRVAFSILQYETAANATVDGWELQFSQIPEPHRQLLRNYHHNCERARACIKENADVLEAILDQAEETRAIGPALTAANSHYQHDGGDVDPVNASKVRCPSRLPAPRRHCLTKHELCASQCCAVLHHSTQQPPKTRSL